MPNFPLYGGYAMAHPALVLWHIDFWCTKRIETIFADKPPTPLLPTPPKANRHWLNVLSSIVNAAAIKLYRI